MDNERMNGSSMGTSIFDEDGSYRMSRPQSYYSDASFSPAGESTEPTRFYTPVKKTEKTSEEKKSENRSAKEKRKAPAITLVLCLLCLCIGALTGLLVSNSRYSKNLSEMDIRLSSLESINSLSVESSATRSEIEKVSLQSLADTSVSPSQIYDDACRSVVGITSEITYTNFFGMRSSSAVSGTGFVISTDGYLITNYHVIEAAYLNHSSISAVFHDGSSYAAKLVGADSEGDIAVLKIEAEACVPAPLGDSSDILVGDEVFAVGNPLGELSFTMTSGRVSALDRSISTDNNSVPINMFQIDAPVNSGNSGGPLYNARGEVIGVITAKYSSSSIEGIGFAIPINQVQSVASDLITKGYVTGKPFLGVMIDQRYTGTYSYYYGLPMGAYVNSVERGSCAELSGIRPGDIITSIADTAISGSADLQTILSRFRAGDSLNVTVFHGGAEQTFSITLDENQGDSKYT